MPEVLRRPEAALFALALGAYAYFYQAGGWNQNSRFDLVRAIVERGTSSIEGYHHNTGDLARKGGVHYCDKAPGASWLGALAYGIVHASAGPEDPGPGFLATSAYLTTVLAVGLPSAAGVVALYLLLVALGLRRRSAAPFAVAYGFATLAFPYSTLFYGHQLAASLLLIAFAILVRARQRLRVHGEAPRPAGLVIAGLVLGVAVVVEYPAALAVLALCAYAARAFGPRRWQCLGWIAAGGLAPALALTAYHSIVFGGPLQLPYHFSTQPHRGQGFMGIGVPSGESLWGLSFSRYRGLFYSAPWLLLAVPGAALLMRRRDLRAEGTVVATIALAFFWLNLSLVDWQGGWALGPRYLIPALPFLAIAAAGTTLWSFGSRWKRRAAHSAVVIAMAYSALAMLAGTAVKPEVPSNIERPFDQYVVPHLARGELAVSTQGIHMSAAPPDGPRQAWNLGHGLGLDGIASLVPLLLFAAACGLWLWRTLPGTSSPCSAPGD